MNLVDSLLQALPEGVIPLVPMRAGDLHPGERRPLTVQRARSIAAVLHALIHSSPLGVVLQTDAQAEEPGNRRGLSDQGTLASLEWPGVANIQMCHVQCRGVSRFRIDGELIDGYPFLAARVRELPGDSALRRSDQLPIASTRAISSATHCAIAEGASIGRK